MVEQPVRRLSADRGADTRRGNEMTSTDYKIYERTEGMWVIAHIVGETPAALDRGISDYRHRFKYHDAGQPERLSSLTAEVKRFYKL